MYTDVLKQFCDSWFVVLKTFLESNAINPSEKHS